MGYFNTVARVIDSLFSRVAQGGTVLDPEVVRQLLGASRRADSLATLTPREREVLSLMAQGRSNAAIAGTLVISAGVVEKHVASHPLAQVTAHGEDFGQAFDRTASPDILRYVPKYSGLDQIFHALGDSSRRAMVERLSRGPASVSELAKPFPVALPTVVQHLGVLETAGIVTSAKAGRVRTYQLVPGALDGAGDWIGRQRLPAERRLDRLGTFLDRPTTTKE